LGHTVRSIPPQGACHRAYPGGQAGRNDAEAISEAAGRPNIHPVPVKSAAQQAAAMALLGEEIAHLDTRIKKIEVKLLAAHRASPLSMLLATIRGRAPPPRRWRPSKTSVCRNFRRSNRHAASIWGSGHDCRANRPDT